MTALMHEGDTVHGIPRLILRLEGLLAFGLAVALHWHLGFNWIFFALFFLVPDVSMLGYLRGPRPGAAVYNIGHTYLTPAALGLCGVLLSTDIAMAAALIWAAHIGFDRILGYGLKYPDNFQHTHLARSFQSG
jgi:Domain of unknown function (DUF4260)